MLYKMVYWTGPSMVSTLAQRARESGLTVVCEGAEYIYLETEAINKSTARNIFKKGMKCKDNLESRRWSIRKSR